MPEDLELTKAEQQLTGFSHAYQGYSITSLIEEMGLRSEEWEILKDEMKHLPSRLVKEIDEYFNRKNT